MEQETSFSKAVVGPLPVPMTRGAGRSPEEIDTTSIHVMSIQALIASRVDHPRHVSSGTLSSFRCSRDGAMA